MGARALNQTKLAVAKPAMNTDTKSTDIPYRPSKAPGITRCTTLLMIAYGDAYGFGDGMRGRRRRAPPPRGRTSVPCSRNGASKEREQAGWQEQGRAGTLLRHRFRAPLIFNVSV